MLSKIKEDFSDYRGLEGRAKYLRKKIVSVLHPDGGHFGGCLSVIDILHTLYTTFLNVSPETKDDPLRDRLILSKGHSAVALYVLLAELGFIPEDWLESYSDIGSPLAGHPDMTLTPGIDFSSGSLGQGLSAGIGMAMSLPKDVNVWVVLGDGECQEGQVWEAAMLAGRYHLSNLFVVVDNNGQQEFGWGNVSLEKRNPLPDPLQKWGAFGWNTYEADGNNYLSLTHTFRECLDNSVNGKPTVVIANTVKGYGSPLLQKEPLKCHCGSLTDEEYNRVLHEIS
ncbi:transketolase [Desulfoluna spongiiphila]|uniref:Transketolase subunit A n=1 Tax=Desulfoluna spongiiphila TaxID=419481 RepID=A0A1G5HXM5_9BACT|nr:transketolase [Desulfoluna spongiiphila]SCY68546.1 transketolase subunit A [Desulfoluna spongiiphila]